VFRKTLARLRLTLNQILDGLAATTRIRKREEAGEGLLGQAMTSSGGSRLPIIVVTANVRKEQIDTAIAAGAVGTIKSKVEKQANIQ
jgi:CheY-like chemotaxis protein